MTHEVRQAQKLLFHSSLHCMSVLGSDGANRNITGSTKAARLIVVLPLLQLRTFSFFA
uniref:Uncharacterized protein n=1 Tax=Physcomitrium patens TaxID=3218 RepID=A0A2K1J7Y0_PHYPA|nr:hypothetical protein PHYPA_020742 [Physcomitrium patens]